MFSPDGKRLVFERIASGFTANGGKHAVFVIDADGTHLRRLTPWAESSGDNPDWSPDGKWIVFHTHVDEEGEATQIFLIHPDGTGRRQVTRFPENVQLGSTSFSPDGKQLVISEGKSDGNLHVYTMRLDGTKLHRVTRSAMWDSAPAWVRAPDAGGAPHQSAPASSARRCSTSPGTSFARCAGDGPRSARERVQAGARVCRRQVPDGRSRC